MNTDALERWSRGVRRLASVLAGLWPIAVLTVLTRDRPTDAAAFAAMTVGCCAIAVRCLLPGKGGFGWAGTGRVFTALWVLIWTAAFTAFWLSAPLVVQRPEMVFAPGAAVGRAVAMVTLVVHAVALVLGVVLACVLALVYRALARTRISRLGRVCASGGALTLCWLSALVASAIAQFGATERVPLEHYPSALPVVQLLEGSNCYEFTTTAGTGRVVSGDCAWDHAWCKVGINRQPSDAPCQALVVQQDAASGALLASARTLTGDEPVVWCQFTPRYDCPRVVTAIDVQAAVAIPFCWRLTAWLGLGLALLCVATGWHVLRRAAVASEPSHGLKLDFANHVCAVALVVVVALSTPLLVALGLGFR